MQISIHNSKDQNNNNLFGAIVNDVVIPCNYKNRFALLRRVAVVKNLILTNNYSHFLKY